MILAEIKIDWTTRLTNEQADALAAACLHPVSLADDCDGGKKIDAVGQSVFIVSVDKLSERADFPPFEVLRFLNIKPFVSVMPSIPPYIVRPLAEPGFPYTLTNNT